MAVIFFFNYCINTLSKQFKCLQNKFLDILVHSSSIVVLSEPTLGFEVELDLFSKSPQTE